MNRTQLITSVQRQMPSSRWQHTLGVMDTAIELADRYGANAEQAELAAILHDVCKFFPDDQLVQIIREHPDSLGTLVDVLDYDKQLWHAPAGAIIAVRDYGVSDEAVLDAIRYHTTGRPGMTLLDKIVCLADYIEPGRNFSGLHIIREIAEHSLDQALIAAFDSTISFLLEKGFEIYPLTVASRNFLLRDQTSNM